MIVMFVLTIVEVGPIIGGIGIIEKPNINIRNHHMFVSKSAYVAQNMIASKGLSFFREFENEKEK